MKSSRSQDLADYLIRNAPGLDPPTFENLFYAGDNRVNQQGALISTQTTWAKEHNYQVDQLTPLANAQGWTQDELFEAARAINEAEFQHVVYDEYVPKLIGSQADVLLDGVQGDARRPCPLASSTSGPRWRSASATTSRATTTRC